MVAQLFAGAFEGDGERLAIGLAEDFFQSHGIDQQEVFKDEHQVADGLGKVGVLLVDVVEDLAAGGGVQTVEHLGHGADAAVRLAAEFTEGFEFLPDDGGDFENDLGGNLIEAGHALGDVRPHGGGKRSEQGRGLGVVQVREHQGDGLRMLVMDEFRELLGIGFLDGVEGCGVRAQGFGEAVEQALGVVRLEGAHEQFAGVIDTTARDVIAGIGDVVKLFENRLRLLRRNGGQLGHFAADLLDFLFV